MNKKLLLFLSFIVTVGILLGGLYSNRSVSQKIPDISFTLLDGRYLTSHALRGQPILLYFWASTCSTCMEELPLLTALYQEFVPQGLQIIAVPMYYDPPNHIAYIVQQYHLSYPIALDVQGTIAQAFDNIKVVPTHFFINSQGIIVHKQHGKLQENPTRQLITQLLKERVTYVVD